MLLKRGLFSLLFLCCASSGITFAADSLVVLDDVVKEVTDIVEGYQETGNDLKILSGANFNYAGKYSRNDSIRDDIGVKYYFIPSYTSSLSLDSLLDHDLLLGANLAFVKQANTSKYGSGIVNLGLNLSDAGIEDVSSKAYVGIGGVLVPELYDRLYGLWVAGPKDPISDQVASRKDAVKNAVQSVYFYTNGSYDNVLYRNSELGSNVKLSSDLKSYVSYANLANNPALDQKINLGIVGENDKFSLGISTGYYNMYSPENKVSSREYNFLPVNVAFGYKIENLLSVKSNVSYNIASEKDDKLSAINMEADYFVNDLSLSIASGFDIYSSKLSPVNMGAKYKASDSGVVVSAGLQSNLYNLKDWKASVGYEVEKNVSDNVSIKFASSLNYGSLVDISSKNAAIDMSFGIHGNM